MHIADGILPVSLCVAGYAMSLTAAAIGSRKLQTEEVPRMGMLAAATFVASCVHIPIAGSSVHFGLLGLLGAMLGLRSVPVVVAVLLLQSFLFQHGGFLTLGVNALNMGAGALSGYLLWRMNRLPLGLRGFLAGFAGMMVPALLVMLEFQTAGYGRSLLVLTGVYALLGILEGGFTSMVLTFLQRTRPNMLGLATPPQSFVGVASQPEGPSA
jgi:cobalt/nickel transport system permease protein